nr:MAG TPA: hypothetical protein [Caudoviricetes sp.]
MAFSRAIIARRLYLGIVSSSCRWEARAYVACDVYDLMVCSSDTKIKPNRIKTV